MSNDGMINKLEIMWTEAVMAEFEVLLRRKPQKKNSVKVVNISAGIRVEYLLNIRQKSYRFSQTARYILCRLLLFISL
jgi:hypothetical protein